ncbi:MAG: MarR family transcriptional regulator [Rhizobiaceae bacterium]|nr:MarR family transcriptional regulator [Rhizobiaceae bacterium]MCV0404953.1 MarR family transcriptional regulator [Rhizobiaceae bacterium]
MARQRKSELDSLAEEQLRRHRLPEGLFTPEDSIAHAFTVVVNRVSLMLENMYRDRYGLTVVGWRLLAIIHNHSPLSAKGLAEYSAMDQVSISRALDQLVSKRLVSRRIDPADRRRVVLRPTKTGQSVYNDIVPLSYAADRALLSSLSESEARAAREMMRKLVERSAEIMSEDQDWISVLARFGYGATGERRLPGEAAE